MFREQRNHKNCIVNAKVTSWSVAEIAGIARENSSSGKIVNCIVTGNIKMNCDAAEKWRDDYGKSSGIAAVNRGSIENCVYTGKITTKKVTDNPTYLSNISGAISAYTEGSIANCYWLKDNIDEGGTAVNRIAYINKESGGYGKICIPDPSKITGCGWFDRNSTSASVIAGTTSECKSAQTLAYSGTLVEMLNAYVSASSDSGLKSWTADYSGKLTLDLREDNMNRNANTIFGFVAAAVLILSGCINNVDTETGGNSNVPDGKCSLTVDSGFSARAAFPSSLAADMVYAAEISYSSSGAKKWLGADFLENSPAVLRNSPSASGEIRFVFCAPEESAEYTITVFACPAGTSVGSAADVENAAAASGQAEFSLKAGQKALETPVKVSLSPVTNKTVSGKGKVNLPLSFDPVLGIVAAEVNVTKDGVSDSGGNNYGFKMEVSGSGARLSAENASAGTYLAIMKFYNSTAVSSSTEVAVNSAVQQVSVYPGMTTDCWFIDGKKYGTTEADGTFKPAALELTKYDFTELYVCGTDGGGESDGKRSFYVSSNFGSSVPDGNDTYDGSMAKPFATVQKAVDTIAASGDTSKKYTVYVDGTVEPLYVDTDFGVSKTFISIGTTASNLDLTIKGLSADARAVLNAKQKDRRYGCVLTSENTSLTLENLKITGGKVNDFGGIYIKSGNLTLKNCVVTKNESSNGGGGIHFDGENLIVEASEISGNKGDPGGICVANGSAKTKIKDSNIKNNVARSGGGLDLAGTSTIEDCEITGNTAESSTGGSGGSGGGLILSNKSCKIINSVISNNTAGESGGGIYINGGTLSLESGAEININKAKNGGGIYIRDGSLNLESGAAISNNTAKKDGGAIYASCEYSTITVNIGEKDDSDDVLIEQNKAKRGGAFYGADNARFVMNAGKVFENYSTGNTDGDGGGAMFIWGGDSNYSTFTMNGGEIIGNMAKSGGAGGAVHIDDGSGKNAAFIMTGGLLSGNKAADEKGNGSKLGGAIYVKKGGKIKFGGSAVIEVKDDGNDIWLADGKTITVTGTLTPGNNVKYTARITPQTYNAGTPLITAESGVTLDDEVGKFRVTGNAESDEWFITTEGKLSKPTAISDFSNVPDFNKYPRLTVSDNTEINKLADLVNTGNTMKGVTITLQNDVTLDSMIGGLDKNFHGTFEGNGKTITSDSGLMSIFYSVNGGGIVKNLTSAGTFICSGIVNNLYSSTVENCINNARITNDKYSKCAGIVGYMSGGNIKNCINNGNISNTYDSDTYVGGICGKDVNGGLILNCMNHGDIETSLKGENCIGGIVGTYQANSNKEGVFNCVNLGNIKVSGTYNAITSNAGGILGYANNYDFYITIKNCVNTGDVLKDIDMTKGSIIGGCNSTEFNNLKYIYVSETYCFKDTAFSGIGQNMTNVKMNFFTNNNDVFTTTEELTVGNTTSNNLIDLLNAWVDANNSSGTEQYLSWGSGVDGKPSLVY
ncbi:MAG: hypothetical protein L6V86_03800 [Treponema sp.]|nr:MAG: hypothetical protein L6V86_03800 [Treponema sp.]